MDKVLFISNVADSEFSSRTLPKLTILFLFIYTAKPNRITFNPKTQIYDTHFIFFIKHSTDCYGVYYEISLRSDQLPRDSAWDLRIYNTIRGLRCLEINNSCWGFDYGFGFHSGFVSPAHSVLEQCSIARTKRTIFNTLTRETISPGNISSLGIKGHSIVYYSTVRST